MGTRRIRAPRVSRANSRGLLTSGWPPLLAILAASVLGASAAAHAQVLTHTETVNLTSSLSFSGPGSGAMQLPVEILLPQFDPSRGTLLGVTVNVRRLSGESSVVVTNTSTSETGSFEGTMSTSETPVSAPGFASAPVGFVLTTPGTLSPGESATTLTGAPFPSLPFSQDVEEPLFALYVGTGTVTVRASSGRSARLTAVTGLSDPEAMTVTGSMSATIEASITYTFEPAATHFACYGALAAEPFARGDVTLVDQFREATVTVTRVMGLCNPADTNGENPGAENSPDHLVAYAIAQSVPPKFTPVFGIEVEDQFGTWRLDALTPDRLLVPGAKSLSAPPDPPEAPGVDHFVCYTVQTSAGAPKFARIRGVSVVDQFGMREVDLAKPSRLCNPVNKNGEEPGAEANPMHLMCYEAQRARGAPHFSAVGPIFAADQFGPQQLTATTPGDLCVPALKTSPVP